MPSYVKGEKGCVGKADSYWWAPEDLILITDPGTAGYDPRAILPPDPALVRSIMRHGVKIPILIRPGEPVVVDGRRRTIAAREANRQRLEAGQAPIRVKCIVSDGSDAAAESVAVICNEMRLDDNPAVRAEKAARLVAHGYGTEEIADMFGVRPAAVREWLKLAAEPPAVIKAVKERKKSVRAVARERKPNGHVKPLGKKAALALMDDPVHRQWVADEAGLNSAGTAWHWYCAGLRKGAGIPPDA